MKNAQPTLTRAETIICKIASQFPGNGSYSYSIYFIRWERIDIQPTAQ